MVVAGAWRASVMRPPTPTAGARNNRHSSLLQLAAWGVPAALAAAVLVTRDVDADELTGKFLCNTPFLMFLQEFQNILPSIVDCLL